jgi:hypothetical protein
MSPATRRPVQSLCFQAVQAKHEILGKAFEIALNGLVQCLRGHAVELGELGVEKHFVATQHEDGARNVLAAELPISLRRRIHESMLYFCCVCADLRMADERTGGGELSGRCALTLE